MGKNKTATVRFQRFAIIGKCENRPGTGRILTFPCVITYRTGADWRLYMKTSADARSKTLRRPAGVFKDRLGSVRCPVSFTLYVFLLCVSFGIYCFLFVIIATYFYIYKMQKQ